MAATTNKLPVIPADATYASQLKKLSDENPTKEAYVFIDKHWNRMALSRKDVWDMSRKYAAILKRHGVKKGDIVCNTLVNSPERLITGIGTLLTGAASMHGQIFLADGVDLIHNCKKSKCQFIIIDSGDSKGAAVILNRIQYKDEKTGETRYKELPDLTTVLDVSVVCSDTSDQAAPSYKRGYYAIEKEQDMFVEPDVKPEDMAFIFSTSGSTGFSKQCPYTHRSCLLNGRAVAYCAGVKSDQSRYYLDRSLGWLGGFPGSFLGSGATRILTDHSKGLAKEKDEHVLHILNEENIDSGLILPDEIEILINSINSGNKLRKRMRGFGIGGMPLTERILKAVGVITDSINIGYGSTEGGCHSWLIFESGVKFEEYCVGYPMEEVEMKVVDEDYKEVPTGQFGTVAVRSPMNSSGYLNDPEKNREAFMEDGYFLTGDTGYKRKDGLFFVYGRQVHAIHRGIFIHYPGWIESRILKCPGVQNVIVMGVPDPVNHEAICACVIPFDKEKLTEEQLKDHCASLFLTDTNSEMSAMPQYFLMFDVFPYNKNGKVDRNILKVQACKRLNIG